MMDEAVEVLAVGAGALIHGGLDVVPEHVWERLLVGAQLALEVGVHVQKALRRITGRVVGPEVVVCPRLKRVQVAAPLPIRQHVPLHVVDGSVERGVCVTHEALTHVVEAVQHVLLVARRGRVRRRDHVMDVFLEQKVLAPAAWLYRKESRRNLPGSARCGIRPLGKRSGCRRQAVEARAGDHWQLPTVCGV